MVKSPGELFDKIEAVFMAGGMPLSELAYDGRNAFSSKELKETFNLDKFQRGVGKLTVSFEEASCTANGRERTASTAAGRLLGHTERVKVAF